MNGVCVCGLEYGSLSLVCFCLVWSLFVSVCICVSVCFCVSISAIYILYVCNAVHDACFFGIHMALSLHPHQRQF